jgi:hypothetical protein
MKIAVIRFYYGHIRHRINRLRRRYDSVYVERHPRDWHHSSFPHPLVTLDFDEENNLIGVGVVGKNMKADLT